MSTGWRLKQVLEEGKGEIVKYGLILLNGSTPGAGLTIAPEMEEVTLGRDAARDLPLDDNHCSRLHARVWFDTQRWQIEDCGSSNGTFVNSRRIKSKVLLHDDIISLGDHRLKMVYPAGHSTISLENPMLSDTAKMKNMEDARRARSGEIPTLVPIPNKRR